MAKPFPEVQKSVGPKAVANVFFPLGLYFLISLWLFLPYAGRFSGFGFIYAVNPIIAAWGTYLVGRRWIANSTPLILAGAVYGFGPYALSFSMYHPLAGMTYAMIPWLFLPSVYWHRSSAADTKRFVMRALLSLLPFASILALFWVLSQPWAGPYFLMPQAVPLTLNDFQSLFFPLYRISDNMILSIYHVPLILALMGTVVLVNMQRIALLIPFAAAIVLCFLDPICGVSPIVWAAFPVLLLSLLSALGFQSLLYAGKADSKWIAACAVIASLLAAFFGGISFYPLTGREFDLTAILYAAAAGVLFAVYYLTRLQVRFHWVRWALLTGAAALDFVLSARFVIGKIF